MQRGWNVKSNRYIASCTAAKKEGRACRAGQKAAEKKAAALKRKAAAEERKAERLRREANAKEVAYAKAKAASLVDSAKAAGYRAIAGRKPAKRRAKRRAK